MLKGIIVSGYNSKSGLASYGSGSLDVALKLVNNHHFPTSQVKGEMMETTQHNDYSIL